MSESEWMKPDFNLFRKVRGKSSRSPDAIRDRITTELINPGLHPGYARWNVAEQINQALPKAA